MVHAAVHYTHEHPEVTFHTLARLDRTERHLRGLMQMALALFADRLPPEEVARWRAEAEEGIAPLSSHWLSDLLLIAEREAEIVSEARMEASFG